VSLGTVGDVPGPGGIADGGVAGSGGGVLVSLCLQRIVRPYIRIWPRMRVYEKIRLHTWMWSYNRVVDREGYRGRSQTDRESSIEVWGYPAQDMSCPLPRTNP